MNTCRNHSIYASKSIKFENALNYTVMAQSVLASTASLDSVSTRMTCAREPLGCNNCDTQLFCAQAQIGLFIEIFKPVQ